MNRPSPYDCTVRLDLDGESPAWAVPAVGCMAIAFLATPALAIPIRGDAPGWTLIDLFVYGFPIAGLLMAALWGNLVWRRRRFTPCHLMLPAPRVGGGMGVRGAVVCEREPPQARSFLVHLACLEMRPGDEGEKTHWQEHGEAEVVADDTSFTIPFAFTPPPGLPRSGIISRSDAARVTWRLVVRRGGFFKIFELPVDATT